MFFPSHDTVEDVVLQVSHQSHAWEQEIVPSLPKDLEEQAWRLEAMSRKSGKVLHASDLLRGILAYVLCAHSFRGLGVWGVIASVADMAGTSWRERLRKSGDWLFWLLSELIRPERHEPCLAVSKPGYGPVELVDASHWKEQGKQGKTWRFHCMYSLCTQQIHQVLISSTKKAETITNFLLQKGAIYVHDSAYGHRKQIAAIGEAGAYAVSAFYPGNFPVEDAEGQACHLIAWLKKRRARVGSIASTPLFFWDQGKRYEIRVIALRRTAEQQERELKKKKKAAGKDHRNLQKETVYLSHWMIVLTTLPAQDWSCQEVLSLYRARWQIEMLFKRMKQLLSQHTLKAKTEKTATATVAALLISWVLQHEVAMEIRSLLKDIFHDVDIQQEHEREEEERMIRDVSEWALQKVSSDLFRQQVQGLLTRQRVRACAFELKRHVEDTPRQRTQEWRRVMQWLTEPAKKAETQGEGKSRKTGSALTTALA